MPGANCTIKIGEAPSQKVDIRIRLTEDKVAVWKVIPGRLKTMKLSSESGIWQLLDTTLYLANETNTGIIELYEVPKNFMNQVFCQLGEEITGEGMFSRTDIVFDYMIWDNGCS